MRSSWCLRLCGGLGRGSRVAFIAVDEVGSRTGELVRVLCSLARSSEGIALLASPPDKLPPSAYDRRSVVFFYSTRQDTLEPSYGVSVDICRENCASVLKDVESVQKRSWGFTYRRLRVT